MKTLSLEQMENTEGGKFWGSTYTCSATGVCTRYYSVIWIKWQTKDITVVSDCDTQCGDGTF